MLVARRGRQLTGAGSLSVAAPYVELADRHESTLDGALLNVWGRISSHLLSVQYRKQFDEVVKGAENLAQQLAVLPDDRLRQAADELRHRFLSSNRNADRTALAFALAREAARRHTGMRHFRVQLLGAAAMLGGALAEMQTGEGKTLTALLPAVAAALMGRPVHIVTVNDYLARRDAEQLRPVYGALGLSVGLIEHGQDPKDRRLAYGCDVTYCTNKELVFDYLRDRLALGSRRARTRLLIDELFGTQPVGQSQQLLLRGLHFAIVDEADSVLIDEARTPLILSGMNDGAEHDIGLYAAALDIARHLIPREDFELLPNEKRIRLTAGGEGHVAELASGLHRLWAVRRAREELIEKALSAIHLFRRDVQYIVANGKVQIVDEYTGRVVPDRSWERGLQQIIETKENCAVTRRHSTLARITYQRFFRRYLHLCGMTGTAIETAGELCAVYGLRVVRIPTNRPSHRTNSGTRMFRTAELKWNAVVESARSVMRQGRAVLIGTRSVNASEHVAGLLVKAGLKPVILNARQDHQEADIVAGAGQPGRVTVATNMAGRGTDIQLHPAVRDAGGLHVILTEYHESRRIDRQLFGRAGRRGDPGTYESIVALDDELFQRFAGKQLRRIAEVQRRPQIPRPLACALRGYSQSAAERLHTRTRRMTLAEDQRYNELLGFAGAE